MIQYILLGFIIALPIGAISIEMTKQGLQNGFWYAWMVGIGAITVDICMLFALNLGLIDVLNRFKTYLWLLGAIFLTQLGWQSIKCRASLSKECEAKTESLFKIFRSGLMIGLNPGNIVFWLSVLGTSIAGASNNTEMSLVFVSLSILLGIALHDVLLAGITSFFRRFMTPKAEYIVSIAAGIALFGFAAYFAKEWAVSVDVVNSVRFLVVEVLGNT
ncbi:LysE family transporter [Solibacillus sp. FSL R5-0449]|uniref:LysE family translocator n=1 Tax=Solibacillus sp. FSL R5-0449 TaxID=2921639 RepID=UPI0030D30BCB